MPMDWRSGRLRPAVATAAVVLLALFLILVRPAATDVVGQTVPSPSQVNLVSVEPGAQSSAGDATVSNQTAQNLSVQRQGDQLRITAPPSTPIQATGAACQAASARGNELVCSVSANARVVVSAGVPAAPAAVPVPAAAPAPAAAAPPPVAPVAAAPVAPAPQATPAPAARQVAPAAAATAAGQPTALARTGAGMSVDHESSRAMLSLTTLFVIAASTFACAAWYARRQRR